MRPEELEAESAREDGRDPDLVRLEELAAALHAKGVDFRVEHGAVVTPKSATDRDRDVTVDLGRDHYRIGVVSDTHGGSKYEQLTALRSFYRYADEREVDFFLHAGDVTQGPDRMHRDQYLGVHAHGSDQQVDYVAATYPRSERGTKTYVITGNHDDSFLNEGGTNVVRQLCAKRDDWVYVGQDAAYLTIGGLRTYITHPDGGGSYAKSYKLQKLASSLPVEKDVRLILSGHYHSYAATLERGTYALMLPCFQSQYSWLARKFLHPDIGGLILDIWLDDAGRVARIAHELVTYPALEDDWDHEVSAQVSRAWSSAGLEL